MFSTEVEKVIGMSAAEIGKVYEEDKSALAEVANKVNFKQFIFKCRAKYEVYNVSPVRITIHVLFIHVLIAG